MHCEITTTTKLMDMFLVAMLPAVLFTTGKTQEPPYVVRRWVNVYQQMDG